MVVVVSAITRSGKSVTVVVVLVVGSVGLTVVVCEDADCSGDWNTVGGRVKFYTRLDVLLEERPCVAGFVRRFTGFQENNGGLVNGIVKWAQ